MDTKAVTRRFDLDWLRVLAFSAVFLYHCSRFFDSGWWQIKNSTTSPVVDALKSIFDLWGMPLLFVISGAAIFLALRPGGTARFLRDRVLRLLVPLAFGILVLGPPQIYLTRLTHGEFQGSFIEFLPLYFRDWGTWGGNFAWSGVHLWYLEDLFLFTVVLLPLFVALKRPSGLRVIDWLARVTSRRGTVLLWMVPLALLTILADPLGLARAGLSEDVSRLVVFAPFLVYGYLVFSDDRIQQAIIRQRRMALGLAAALTLAAPLVSAQAEEHPGPLTLVIVMPVACLLIWTSILAILGYGMRYLTTSHPRLGYANEAVLPIYILHQPVILLVGFFVIPLTLPILAKYLIILTLAFGITLALYEFGVRRWNPVRRLFGLKPRQPVLQEAKLAAQPAS
jgi:peptidoglycan/LPS O-acetylase OafA/YrhL